MLKLAPRRQIGKVIAKLRADLRRAWLKDEPQAELVARLQRRVLSCTPCEHSTWRIEVQGGLKRPYSSDNNRTETALFEVSSRVITALVDAQKPLSSQSHTRTSWLTRKPVPPPT
jgi:hypothetical protein